METANFFTDGSPFLHHPLLTTERTAAEVDFLLAQFTLKAQARILDVGCGFGRHSIELAKRGYAVVGIDPSPAMIAAAAERTRAATISADFHCADGESFATVEPFDAAICLFTTLGQMTGAGDNRGLVGNVFSLLRSGGCFAVETPQRDTAVAILKRAEHFGDSTAYTNVERHFDADTTIVTERFHVVSPQKSEDFVLRYRLFSVADLTEIMQNAGFKVESRFSNYRGDALDIDSPSMLLIGRKS